MLETLDHKRLEGSFLWPAEPFSDSIFNIQNKETAHDANARNSGGGQAAGANNWVDAPTADAAAQRGSVSAIQVFNNRALDGTFLPETILGTSTEHQAELTTDAELMYATL